MYHKPRAIISLCCLKDSSISASVYDLRGDRAYVCCCINDSKLSREG